MISKRVRRSSSPQENLKQFSLNNSKGIDGTKPITDPDTVLDMENLEINPDGSLSIRKPMLSANAVYGVKEHLMYDNEHVVCVFPEGIAISKRGSDAWEAWQVKCTTYYTYVERMVLHSREDVTHLPSASFDFSKASFVNVAGATIVGNCFVSAEFLKVAGALDDTLYDADVLNRFLPRYVKISKEPDVPEWVISVINPELNQIVTAEGDISLNPNMCLDSPYAIRDYYMNTVPSVSGILPYLYDGDAQGALDNLGSGTTVTSGHFKHIAIHTPGADDARADLSEPESTATPFTTVTVDTEEVPLTVYTSSDGLVRIKGDFSKLPGSVTLSLKLKLCDNGARTGANVALDVDSTHKYALNERVQGIEEPLFFTGNGYANVYGGAGEVYVGVGTATSVYGHYNQLYFDDHDKSKSFDCSVWLSKDLSVYANTLDDAASALKYAYNIPEYPSVGSFKVRYVRYDASGEPQGQRYRTYAFGYSAVTGKLRLYLKELGSSTLWREVGTKYSFKYVSDKATLHVYDSTTVLNTLLDRDTAEDVLEDGSYEFNASTATAQAGISYLKGSVYISEILSDSEWYLHTRALADWISSSRVSDITENVLPKHSSFKLVRRIGETVDTSRIFLKAFCKLPKSKDVYYATWDYSLDGVSWNPYGALTLHEYGAPTVIETLSEEYVPSTDVESQPPSDVDYVKRNYHLLAASSPADLISSRSSHNPSCRIDVLPFSLVADVLDRTLANASCMVRFRIVTVKDKSESLRVNAIVASQEFYIPVGSTTVYEETDAPNAVLGEKLYYKKAIYSYGTSDYKSIVHVSDPGSFITPMYNAIDLDAYSEDIVTAVVPWRDYLLISTEKAVYLSSKTSSGFYTKLVSSSIGVDLKDRRSAVAALNGMVFKHGDAVYLAYPNLYASDDTILMLTDISKPISHILGAVDSSESSFAIYHDDKYVLMLPDESSTRCLIYDTSEKRWSNFTYPVKFYDFFGYSKDGLSTRTAVGSNFEYFIFDAPADQGADETGGRYADVSGDTVIPIQFMLDTGQKTDSILHTKQFVETKLMFATLSDEDAFPLTLYVAIDGDPHVTRTDVSTDAPFWKTSDGQSRGVLGTAFTFGGASNPATGTFNTLRQLIVRHSGKGKSIRYVLEGESLYNFKLYETYVRYKNLNIKQ